MPTGGSTAQNVRIGGGTTTGTPHDVMWQGDPEAISSVRRARKLLNNLHRFEQVIASVSLAIIHIHLGLHTMYIGPSA